MTKSPTDGSGDETELGTLCGGNSFGELSTIDGLPRSASVTALGPITCYFLPRLDFMLGLTESPELGLAMIEAFATMVRRTNNLAGSIIDPPQAPRQFIGVRSFRS